MEFDYAKLRGKIRERFDTERNFAAAMGIGRVAMSQKLNNESDFTRKQMLKAAELLGIKPEEFVAYFFTEKVQKHEQTA